MKGPLLKFLSPKLMWSSHWVSPGHSEWASHSTSHTLFANWDGHSDCDSHLCSEDTPVHTKSEHCETCTGHPAIITVFTDHNTARLMLTLHHGFWIACHSMPQPYAMPTPQPRGTADMSATVWGTSLSIHDNNSRLPYVGGMILDEEGLLVSGYHLEHQMLTGADRLCWKQFHRCSCLLVRRCDW